MNGTNACRGCGTEVKDGDGWLHGVCDDCHKRHLEAQKRMKKMGISPTTGKSPLQ